MGKVFLTEKWRLSIFSIMNDFWLWVINLVRRWQRWFSGGGVGGLVILLLYLSERFWGFTMSKLWYFPIFIFVYMLYASYMAWRDEHKLVIGLTAQLETKKNKKEISDKLAAFIRAGLIIQNQCAVDGAAAYWAYEQLDREIDGFAKRELSDYDLAVLTNVYDETPRVWATPGDHTWHFVGLKIKRLEMVGKKYDDPS